VGLLTRKTGVLTPGSEFEARLKFFNNKMVWEDPKSSITFDKVAEKITTSVSSGNITEVMDGKNKKMTTTVGTCVVDIDGTANKVTVTAGSTIIEIDGASGKIKLTSDFVDIGKAVSDFAVLFTELSTAFNTHTHMHPPGPGAPAPTSPPTAPMLQSVGSTSVKLQP
jgi:hypothetical protein